MEVPLICFFEEEPNDSADDFILRQNKRKKLNSPVEKAGLYLISPSNHNRNIEMHMIVIEPGGKIDRLYVNDTEEVGYILKGTLTFYLDHSGYELHAGDSI